MALPQLNATPKYQLTIPSTGQKVSYRPYLVKEEKILLMAFESKETRSILRAMLDTIGACVQEEIDLASLATFDVEYMFLQIRAKSVGETSTVVVPCSSCKEEGEVQINIEDVNVDVGEKGKNLIEIADKVWVELKYPTYSDIINSEMIDEGHQTSADDLFDLIIAGISAILTEEERFDAKDQSKAELQNFVDSLTSAQMAKINEFFDNTPQLKKDVEFICQKCGHKNDLKLAGMADFF